MDAFGVGGALEWCIGQLRTLSPSDWALAAGAFVLIRASSRLGMWPYALIAFPGTLAHELAHYLVAKLLAAKPSFPSLVPQRSEHGWRLGSVGFRAGWLRSVPIALAPLALLPLGLVYGVLFLAPASWPMTALHAWIMAALLSASLPSRADFRIAIPALLVAALALLGSWILLR
jgi:hypothetical protein